MKIKSIKYIGKRRVFDIKNIEDNHNFIANDGFIVHNCTTENWAKKENKDLKVKLAQIRTKHLLFILCFPLKIEKVDKIYLESYVQYWTEIFSRGIGGIFVKDKNPSRDSWRIKEFANVGSFNEFTPQSQVEKILKKHPNFWMTVRFPKPSKKLYDAYLNVREKNVYSNDAVMSMITKEDIYRALLILSLRDIMMNDSTLSMNRIMLHIKNEYDMPLSKVILESVIDDAKKLIAEVKNTNHQIE